MKQVNHLYYISTNRYVIVPAADKENMIVTVDDDSRRSMRRTMSNNSSLVRRQSSLIRRNHRTLHDSPYQVFVREIHALMRLSHPNICKLREVYEESEEDKGGLCKWRAGMLR